MNRTVKVYRTKDGRWTARKTAMEFTAAACNESFRRQYPDATTPTAWGIIKGDGLKTVADTRDTARSLRKPGETVVALWV